MDFDEQFRDIADRLSMEMHANGSDSGVFLRSGEVLSINLPLEIRALLGKVFRDLAEILEERDPAADVLFKNPYEDTEDKAAWDLLAGESLRAERVERARCAADQARDGFMSIEDTQNWLRVANDVRIVLCGREPTEDQIEILSYGSDAVCVVYQLMTGLVSELLSVW
jgi:hypothetical protein